MSPQKEVDGNAGAYLLYNGSSNIFQIGTNISSTDTPSMTLLRDGTGKVGIGTATVSSKLHIDNANDVTALFVDSNYRENTRFHSTESNQGTRVWIPTCEPDIFILA